jgi:hypothetical protein
VTPGPLQRRILLVLVILLLAALAWLGLRGGMHQWGRAETAGQAVQTWAQVIYGVLSLFCIPTAFNRVPWASAVHAAWAASLTTAGGLAPVVWGGASWVAGLLATGTSVLIAAIILWLLRMSGPPAVPDRPPTSA